MNTALSQTEKDQLRYKLETNAFSTDEEIARLVDKGYDEAYAKDILLAELRDFKQHLFNQKMQQNKQGELQNVMIGVIAMLTLIGPVFDIIEPVWYMVAFAGACICGYFAAKNKPIAGAAAGILYGLIFPLAHNMYFSGRTRFIRIELIIPIIIAAIPAFILYFILSKTLYANSNKESYDY
ncbi:MAG TPA: hypothetical protein VM187_08060 [Niastella sp.]|nr:hypothetical protein [Niastella sp.]